MGPGLCYHIEMIPGFPQMGVPSWVSLKSLGSRRCVEPMHGRW